MEAITASLERSLQNCSLNNNNQQNGRRKDNTTDAAAEGTRISSTTTTSSSSSSDDNHHHISNSSDTALELNSHISLPYHWEQCLDLKTGEIYYINWRNGMKAKEDPRRAACEDESEEEEEESWYDDDSEEEEESSSECSISKDQQLYEEKQNVLVVAGCKSCLMYFMVPKQGEDCPKCNGQLLHFDRSENCSP